jgi:ATP-dependent exoDNAse (exonuclease V) beta subunit
LQRPDLKEKVAAHCRLESDEVEALAMQADGLRRALIEQGYPDLHVEQPLEIALADGGTQTVILDLIAEGHDGYLIVDHKSGAVADHAARFATYWPQLAAYVDAVEAMGSKAVSGVAIFWTDAGELTLSGRSVSQGV